MRALRFALALAPWLLFVFMADALFLGLFARNVLRALVSP